MTNFGFGRLGVVNAYNIGFREARSAVGAADLLRNAVEYASVAEAVADCTLVVGTTAVRHRDVQHPVRQLENGGRLIRKRLATGRVALYSVQKSLAFRIKTSATATGSCEFPPMSKIFP